MLQTQGGKSLLSSLTNRSTDGPFPFLDCARTCRGRASKTSRSNAW